MTKKYTAVQIAINGLETLNQLDGVINPIEIAIQIVKRSLPIEREQIEEAFKAGIVDETKIELAPFYGDGGLYYSKTYNTTDNG